jgi:hypothetical protein
MKFFLPLIFGALFVSGCATTHSGSFASSKDSSLKVSVARNSDLTDKYYIFYEYTIENTTPEWKQIQVVDILFDNQKVEVLLGDKLSAWVEGAELKLKASEYNKDMLLGSMIAIGGITALTSQNTSVQQAGAAAVAGGAAGGVALEVSRAHKNAVSGVKGLNGTVNVPQTHVFVPSKIAPESFIKRWIVVRMPEPPKNVKMKDLKKSIFYKQDLMTMISVDGSSAIPYTLKVSTSLRDLGAGDYYE